MIEIKEIIDNGLILRNELGFFANYMEKILKKNDFKEVGEKKLYKLYESFKLEVKELEVAFENIKGYCDDKHYVNFQKECIDVANFCMMMFIKLRKNVIKDCIKCSNSLDNQLL